MEIKKQTAWNTWNKGLKIKETHPQCGFQKGHKEFRTNESYKKLRSSMKGNKNGLGHKKTKDVCIKISEKQKGQKGNNWQGSSVGYAGIHTWLRKNYGEANKCENPDCQYKNPKRYDWAKLKDKEYERKLENFWMLCRSCHIKYDRK